MMCSFSNECGVEEAGNNSGRLVLDDMARNDRVLIKTNNSLYQFVFADPALRQGALTGGTLDGVSRSAILIGSIIAAEDGRAGEIPGLKVGARAVFYLVSPAGMERLITSVVINITLVRGSKSLSPLTASSDRLFPSHDSLMPA
jgi:hypothetical protein